MTGISIFLIVVLLLSVVVNILLFMGTSRGKLTGEMSRFLSENISGRLSLAKSLSLTCVGGNAQKKAVSFFNSFIERLRGVFKNVFLLGFNLSTTSDSMKDSSGKLLEMSDQTSFQSAQVATAMEEMSATVNDIANNASAAADSSTATMNNAKSAENDINENKKSIEHLSKNVSIWAETNRALSESTAKIDEIIMVINDIADQTNLLALNAAIEAARAGEHGRGFAIVADEVRKLADRTGQATEEIGGMIRNIKDKVEHSLGTMDSTLKGVEESIGRSTTAEESLKTIVGEVDQVTAKIQQIATAAEEQSSVAENVLSNMEKVSDYAKTTKDLAINISASGDALAALSLTLYSQLCSIKIDSLDEKMDILLKTITASFTSFLSESTRTAGIEVGSLFDDNYIKTGEDDKFKTQFTGFFDTEVLPMLKEWSGTDPRIIYVVVMDRNGYMPTHIIPARAMLKMEDTVSLNGARSDKIIGQAFRRPVAAGGELAVDIAAPLVIDGRHWGCLRIGYLPEMT